MKKKSDFESVGGYRRIYVCFFGSGKNKGEIIGFTSTAQSAAEWASSIGCQGGSVRIVILYELKTESTDAD